MGLHDLGNFLLGLLNVSRFEPNFVLKKVADNVLQSHDKDKVGPQASFIKRRLIHSAKPQRSASKDFFPQPCMFSRRCADGFITAPTIEEIMKSFAQFAFRVAIAIALVNLVLGIVASIIPQAAVLKALINNPAAFLTGLLPNSSNAS